MKPEKYIITFSLVLLALLFINIQYQNRASKGELMKVYNGISARDLYVELPDIDYQYPFLDDMAEAHSHITIIETTYREMELTEIGTYYITAYCPAECGGSWVTASGATCHRADWENRYDEPTTVAIDRRYHSFGDEFYIEEFDRTFIAEDTGPGVRGRWIDIFYEDYSDVLSFPTGYYTVYSVEWVEYTEVTFEYK